MATIYKALMLNGKAMIANGKAIIKAFTTFENWWGDSSNPVYQMDEYDGNDGGV